MNNIFLTPYNNFGQTLTCQTESFITEIESIFIPKFFTPNDDGYNDKWIVKDPINEIEVIYIYNRFGKILKTLNNIHEGWNGIYNAQLMPSGDYWYLIMLKSDNLLKGHFTLKR